MNEAYSEIEIIIVHIYFSYYFILTSYRSLESWKFNGFL